VICHASWQTYLPTPGLNGESVIYTLNTLTLNPMHCRGDFNMIGHNGEQ